MQSRSAGPASLHLGDRLRVPLQWFSPGLPSGAPHGLLAHSPREMVGEQRRLEENVESLRKPGGTKGDPEVACSWGKRVGRQEDGLEEVFSTTLLSVTNAS